MLSLEQRFELLMETSAVIADSIDDPEMLAHLSNTLTERFCKRCLIDLFDERGTLHAGASVNVEPELLPELRQLERAAIEARKPVLHERVSNRIGSAIIVPLVGRTPALGAMTCAEPRQGGGYDEFDLRLAEKLSSRIALAIEHTELFEAEKKATARARMLANATRLFAEPSLDLRGVLDSIA